MGRVEVQETLYNEGGTLIKTVQKVRDYNDPNQTQSIPDRVFKSKESRVEGDNALVRSTKNTVNS